MESAGGKLINHDPAAALLGDGVHSGRQVGKGSFHSTNLLINWDVISFCH